MVFTPSGPTGRYCTWNDSAQRASERFEVALLSYVDPKKLVRRPPEPFRRVWTRLPVALRKHSVNPTILLVVKRISARRNTLPHAV